MNIKYKCVLTQGPFIRGNDYDIGKFNLTNQYDKEKLSYIFLYENKYKDFSILKPNNNGEMLSLENDVIVLIRYDIWRNRQINKILENG